LAALILLRSVGVANVPRCPFEQRRNAVKT
jgi:hypothetical protein